MGHPDATVVAHLLEVPFTVVLSYVDGQVGDEARMAGVVRKRAGPQGPADPVHNVHRVALDGGPDRSGQQVVIAVEILVELGGGGRQHGPVLLQGHVYGPKVGQQMRFGRVA